jgi:hypothetical protein
MPSPVLPTHPLLRRSGYVASNEADISRALLFARRPFALILARGWDALSRSCACNDNRARSLWLLLIRTCPQLGNGRRSATSLSRTVRGPGSVSRSQRATRTYRGHGCLDSDRTSISMWCRHVGSALALGNEVSARYLTSTSQHKRSPRKVERLPRIGQVYLLTTGDLIRVRPKSTRK